MTRSTCGIRPWPPSQPCGRGREAALSLQSFLNTELFAAAEAARATEAAEAAVFGVFV